MENKPGECNNRIQLTIAVLVTIGFFGSLFFLFTFGYPETNRDMINIMLGNLGAIWTLQMQFFFGSSSSSRNKDQTISTMVNTPKGTSNEKPVEPVNQ